MRQQRFVGRDRVRPGAEAGDRVGEHRPARGAREPRSRSRSRCPHPSPRRAALSDARARARRARCTVAVSAGRGVVAVAVHGAPSGRPGASTSAAPVGTSGSRNGRLRCTGPAGGPWAAANARHAIARHVAPAPSIAVRRSGIAEPAHGVAVQACSGRSSGPRRCRAARAAGRPCTRASVRARASASITAGWKFAAAVPDVHNKIAGTRAASPIPSARNAADRSSSTTCTRIRASRAQRERERCRPRPRRDDCVGRARSGPLVDERASERGGCVRGAVTAPPQWCGADRVRPGLHADRELVGRGARPRSTVDTRAVDVPRRADLRRDRERDRRRRRYRHLCRLLDGRPAVPAARRRPPRPRDPTGAGERVARTRGPRRPRSRAAPPTTIWRSTSRRWASTRSCASGSHSRCSRPCPRRRPASPTAAR